MNATPLKYIPGLDTLRAFAVLFVIRQHWGPYNFAMFPPVIATLIKTLLPGGQFGVHLFFVLSGFLLTNILLAANKNLAKAEKLHLLKSFLARRVLRTFPVYFLLIGILYLANYPDIRRYFLYFITFTSNFLMVKTQTWNNLSHMWSLAVEEQFYLVWPLVLIFISKKNILPAIMLFIITGLAASYVSTARYGYFGALLPSSCFSAFAIGGLYSYALVEQKHAGKIKKGLLIALPFALVLYPVTQLHFDIVPLILVNAVISINLIMMIVEKKYGAGLGHTVINNNVLIFLGKISYGIYIYHYIIPYYYGKTYALVQANFILPQAVKLILSNVQITELIQLTLTIALSYVSYRFIELRFLSLKRYFPYSLKTSIAVT